MEGENTWNRWERDRKIKIKFLIRRSLKKKIKIRVICEPNIRTVQTKNRYRKITGIINLYIGITRTQSIKKKAKKEKEEQLGILWGRRILVGQRLIK